MSHFVDFSWYPLSGLIYQTNQTLTNSAATNSSFATYKIPTYASGTSLTGTPNCYLTWVRITYYQRIASADVGGSSPSVILSFDYVSPITQNTITVTLPTLTASTLDGVSQGMYMVPVTPGSTLNFKRTSGGTVGGTPATVMVDIAVEGI